MEKLPINTRITIVQNIIQSFISLFKAESNLREANRIINNNNNQTTINTKANVRNQQSNDFRESRKESRD